VRVLSKVVGLVENEHRPGGIPLKRRPDAVERPVDPPVGPRGLAGQLEVDLGGGTEDCPALLEVDVLDSHVVVPRSELPAAPPRRHRLADARWSVDIHC